MIVWFEIGKDIYRVTNIEWTRLGMENFRILRLNEAKTDDVQSQFANFIFLRRNPNGRREKTRDDLEGYLKVTKL